MNAEALLSFLGRLRNDVNHRVSEDLSEPEAFVAEVVHRLEEHHHLEESVLTFFEKSKTPAGATRIYGIAVSDDRSEGSDVKGDAGAELALLTAVFTNTSAPRPVTKTQVADAARRALRAWELAKTGFHKGFDQHGDAHSLFQRMHGIRDRVKTVRVIVLTDGNFTGSIDEAREEGVKISYDVWDVVRLSRLDSDAEEEPIVIDFEREFGAPLACLAMPVAATDYATWLAIMSGAEVHALYRKYRLRLLERNVRSFLQARGKVNRGIRQTLRTEPGRFLAYNNGLSAIADEVETQRLPDGREAIRRVVGFQIVNGGQTTASIFHGAEETPLFGLYVQLKLTRIMPGHVDEMAPKIAEYANTQNPIRQTDLTSSAPFHVGLEKLAHELWTPDRRSKWFYERVRGAYQNEYAQASVSKRVLQRFTEEWPKTQRFTKAEVAAWMNTWPLSGGPRPYEVSLGAEKNHAKWFVRFLEEQRPNDNLPDAGFFCQLVARGIVFRAMERIAKQSVEGHRSNIVTYCIALMVQRADILLDLDSIWQDQSAPPNVLKWLEDHVLQVEGAIRTSAGARNIGEWCKTSSCWEAVSRATARSLGRSLQRTKRRDG